MRVTVIVLAAFFFYGCATKVSQEQLKYLNGYWEIEEVTFPNGQTKEFKASTTIDYFDLDGLEGFRKKVQPKFNGTYETSNDAELFTIVEKSNEFEIQYKNAENVWQEHILEISENRFSVMNSDTITYSYKRYEPINAPE